MDKISKVLLINPISINVNEFPPLGLLSLAAFIRSKGYEVDVFDESVDSRSLDQIIDSFKPQVFGFSLYTASIASAYTTIAKVKLRMPESIIVVGGPHASALPEFTMQECSKIDFLVFGEGEMIFYELLESLNHKINIEEVRGLCRRLPGSQIILNPGRDRIRNLDDLPFPAFDLIQNNVYPYDLAAIGTKVATIMTSRGCPYSCVFCNRHVFGNKYYKMSAQRSVQMIKWLIDNFHYDEICPMDDLFAFDKTWIREFCREMRLKEIKVPWRCLARANTLEVADFEEMKKNGCFQISFGIESGCDYILEDIKKNLTTSQIRKSVRDARKAKLLTYGFYIIGHRLDTLETIKQTFEFACELNTSFAVFFILTPFPGTTVYNYLPQELKYSWSRINYYRAEGNLPISICNVKPEKLVELVEYLNVKYYRRKKYFFQNIFIFYGNSKSYLIKLRSFLGSLRFLFLYTIKKGFKKTTLWEK